MEKESVTREPSSSERLIKTVDRSIASGKKRSRKNEVTVVDITTAATAAPIFRRAAFVVRASAPRRKPVPVSFVRRARCVSGVVRVRDKGDASGRQCIIISRGCTADTTGRYLYDGMQTVTSTYIGRAKRDDIRSRNRDKSLSDER